MLMISISGYSESRTRVGNVFSLNTGSQREISEGETPRGITVHQPGYSLVEWRRRLWQLALTKSLDVDIVKSHYAMSGGRSDDRLRRADNAALRSVRPSRAERAVPIFLTSHDENRRRRSRYCVPLSGQWNHWVQWIHVTGQITANFGHFAAQTLDTYPSV